MICNYFKSVFVYLSFTVRSPNSRKNSSVDVIAPAPIVDDKSTKEKLKDEIKLDVFTLGEWYIQYFGAQIQDKIVTSLYIFEK